MKIKNRIHIIIVAFILIFSVILMLSAVFKAFNNQKSVEAFASLDTRIAVLEHELEQAEIDNIKMATEYEILSAMPPNQDAGELLSEAMTEFFKTAKQLEKQIIAGENDTKIAYLTFDDGPYDITPDFLKVLKDKNALATFFVLGKPNRVQQYKDAVADGHLLQNHSYSHKLKDGVYNSVDSFMADIKKLDDFLYENVGVRTTVVRFPGGMAQAKDLKKPICAALAEKGYGFVDWNAAAMDGSVIMITAEQAYNNTISQIGSKKTPVVLMHDYSTASLEALPAVIDTLREKGYIFLPLFYDSGMVKKE